MLNLHTHSVYSYKQSTNSLKEIIDHSLYSYDKSFCITDIGSVTSFVKAFALAKENNLKFIPGYELLIEADEDVNKFLILDKIAFLRKELGLKRTTKEQAEIYIKEIDRLESLKTAAFHSLVVIAYNQKGLENIFKSYSEEKENNDGIFVSSNDIILENNEGLIFLTGGNNSEVIFYIQNGEIDKAEYILQQYKEILGDRFYCQIEYCPRLKTEYQKLIDLAIANDIPLVASNEVNFSKKENEADYHLFRNIMDSVEDNIDPDQYFLSKEELTEKLIEFFDISIVEKAIENISKIENLCENIEPPRAKELEDNSKELLKLCEEGWQKLRKETEFEEESRKRFNYELEVINNKNFSQYFIKVLTIVKVAKELNILIGPARGSGAGCEVNYLIGITKIDPIKYGLYFERFLNPSRKGYPDIDLDMASVPLGNIEVLGEDEEEASASRNLLVAELIKRGYFEFAGYIRNEVTASTLVLFKNLCKYYEIPFQDANKISTDDEYAEKLSEKSYTGWLKGACERYGFEWEDVWDQIEKRINTCYSLAKTPWNSSIAASGVIMTDFKTVLPTHKTEAGLAIGFNGEDLESWGYIKFDLLSVNTLNQIQYFEGLEVDWNDYYNPKVWGTIQSGDTDFTFQFSSPGMKHIIKKVKPSDIETLAEINALYRPGPIEAGLIEKYIAIKTGEFDEKTKLTEEEEIISEILKGYYGPQHSGLLVFQEDVMKICELGAGFSLAEADDIRRAMGKKKEKYVLPYKQPFIEGWKTHGYGGDPEKIWETLLGFAKYAFNKSHSVAYAVIGYRTAKIWTFNEEKYIEYSLNFDTKKRYTLAIEKSKELNYGYSYPTIYNMADDYIKIEDKKISLPGGADCNYDSYVSFLFSEGNIYNLIYKGVCDKLTKDRLALVELVSTCLKSAKDAALYMEPEGVRFTTLTQILDGLILVGGIETYTKHEGFIRVLVKRARGKESSEVIFHDDNSSYCRFNICKFDRKFFGKIRPGAISNLPYINSVGIERTLERIKQHHIDRGLQFKIYRDLKEELNNYMYENFKDPFKKTFEDVYAIITDKVSYERSTKIFVSFADKDDIFYVSGANEKIVKAMGKNTLVKMDMVYSPYIAKRTESYIHDFDIISIEEIEFKED